MYIGDYRTMASPKLPQFRNGEALYAILAGTPPAWRLFTIECEGAPVAHVD